MKIFKIVVLFILLSGFSCAGTMQTARTNGRGKMQFGIEPGMMVFTSATTDIDRRTSYAPAFNVSGRYGVSDSVDIGARIGSSVYEIQTKFMFTNPNDMESVAISLAPAITAGAWGVEDDGFFMLIAKIPVIIGIPFGNSELVITPRLTPYLVGGGSGDSSAAFLLSGGGSIGFAAYMGDEFWLLPELSIDIPFLGASSVGDSSSFGTTLRTAVIHAGVGFLFGGRSSKARVMPPATPTPQRSRDSGTAIP